MKKLKINIDKNKIKEKLILSIVIIDICIISWIMFDFFNIPINSLIVYAIAINILLVLGYNRYFEKENKKKEKVINNE